jgi:hypothetical protein
MMNSQPCSTVERSSLGEQLVSTKRNAPSFSLGDRTSPMRPQAHSTPGPKYNPASSTGRQALSFKRSAPEIGFLTGARSDMARKSTSPALGPGTYNPNAQSVGTQVLSRNYTAPQFSLGGKLKNKGHTSIDALYDIPSSFGKQVDSSTDSAPKYTMGTREGAQEWFGNKNPGPGEYAPKLPPGSPLHSFGGQKSNASRLPPSANCSPGPDKCWTGSAFGSQVSSSQNTPPTFSMGERFHVPKECKHP